MPDTIIRDNVAAITGLALMNTIHNLYPSSCDYPRAQTR